MYIKFATSIWNPKNLLFYCFLFFGGLLQAQAVISGKITLADGSTPLSNFTVELTGSLNALTLTDNNGNYNFAVTNGGSYQVRPYAEDGALNGVTTLDAVLIVRYINGIQPFTSPYQRIAADVDESQTITIQDSIVLRDVILGIETQFPGGESWKFIPADYVFPNPASPFPFPTTVSITNLNGAQTGVDFIGVKLGDVNNTALLGGNPVNPYFSQLSGKAVYDTNNNCVQEAGETPLIDWLVVASGFAGEYVTNTKPDGTYTIYLPEGDFTVTLLHPNALWEVCTPPQAIQVDSADSIILPFSAQAAQLCPRLEVDLATGFLRRCFSNTYYVQYCNKGTISADNAYVEVQLDSFLQLQESSIPWTAQNGNTYTFPVGNLASGASGVIILEALLICEAELGQTHCSVAHIFPDTLCVPESSLWNGADLRVTGACNSTEVEFTITNEGEAMTEAVDYVILEDIMIQMDETPIVLGSGESQTFTVPANGSTWRLEVEQPADHPWSQRASAAVEGCGTNADGTFSLGMVNIFPQDDPTPFLDESCIANQGSFDPNDKQGFPKGVGAEHFVPKGQEIQYLIRFQNTGTDTAFTVMIIDTISSLFDLTTLRAGASSHPYTFNLLGQGVAQFVFSNIMLPDSNINEAASHGFVQFTIAPKADLPNGTAVENEAGIYFDFNEPVITNRTRHTFGENYLEVTSIVSLQKEVQLEVYPNPAQHEAFFVLKTARPLEGSLLLYDLQGREVKRLSFHNNTFRLPVADLPDGLYFFRIEAGGTGVATGKMVVAKN